MNLKINRKVASSTFNSLILLLIIVFSVLVTFVNDSWNYFLYGVIIAFFLYYKTYKTHSTIKYHQVPLVIYGFITVGTTFIHQMLTSGFSFQIVWRPFRIILTIAIGYYYSRYTTERDRRRFYSILYVLLLISVAYGFIQYFTGTGWGYNSRMDSFFGHPITYGSLTIIAFWLTFYLFHNRSYVLKLVLCAYIIAGMLSTGSRSAWIAFFVSCIFVLLKQRKGKLSRRAFRTSMVFILLIIAFLFTPYFQAIMDVVSNRFSGTLSTISATQRLGSYTYIFNQISTSNIVEILFGHGGGSAAQIMGNTVISLSSFYTTDSQYLTLLFDYGLIVLALVFALLFIIMKDFIHNTIEIDSEINILAISIAAGGYITAIFYDLFGWLSISTVVCIFVGMWYQQYNNYKGLQE